MGFKNVYLSLTFTVADRVISWTLKEFFHGSVHAYVLS